MTYWVVRLDSSPENRYPDHSGRRLEVQISYPSESKEEARKTADTLNEYEAKQAEATIARNTGTRHHVSPGTTIVSYTVMSEEDLQQFHQIGTRVVR